MCIHVLISIHLSTLQKCCTHGYPTDLDKHVLRGLGGVVGLTLPMVRARKTIPKTTFVVVAARDFVF